VAPDLAERIVARPFREALEVDRNLNPSSGYRAIHLVVRDFGVPYEIQIRTELQDRWAQLSERLNDYYPGIKYGKGPPDIQEELMALSDRTYDVERSFEYTMDFVQGDDVEDVDHRFLFAQEQRAEAEIANLNRLYEAFEETYIR
jgi:ppGpp synthetase/RelA/SpoT-type nucleotidyltranferase